MGFAVGVFALILALPFAIILHEFAHYIFAKGFKVAVSEFKVGFGPKIWSKLIGGTTYKMCLFPFWGHVKMHGIVRSIPKNEQNLSTSWEGISQEFRRYNTSNYLPQAGEKSYYELSPLKKILIMSAGVIANLLLALLVALFALSIIGVPVSSLVLAKVPAQIANLMPADRLISIDGNTLNDWGQARDMIRANPNKEIVIGVLRGNELVEVPVKIGEKTEAGTGEKIGFLGLEVGAELKSLSLGNSFTLYQDFVLNTGKIVLTLPIKIFQLFSQFFLPNSTVDPGVSGILGVVSYAGLIGSQGVSSGDFLGWLSSFLLLFTQINLALAIFNLLPLLPFDGGYIAVAFFDALRNVYCRMRGKKVSFGIDIARLAPFSLIVFIFFIVLTVLMLVGDLLRIWASTV